MKIKKLLCLILAIACCSCILATSAFAKNVRPFDNYVKNKTMYGYTFKDVKRSDWYYSSVKNCYELGLINGKGNSKFDPNGTMTVAEAIAFVVRTHVKLYNCTDSFDNTAPWYNTYVDYAMRHHFKLFITKLNKEVEIDWSVRNYIDFDKAITAKEFCVLVCSAIYDADIYGALLTVSENMINVYPNDWIYNRVVAKRNCLKNDLKIPLTRAVAAWAIDCCVFGNCK